MSERVEIFCDGSGGERVDRPGGWAFVVVKDEQVLAERSGGEAKTTALMMELVAALAALEWLEKERPRAHVLLVSDSRLTLEVVDGTRELKRERYVELAERLRALAARLRVSTKWVRGHSGKRWNERADALAEEAKQAVVVPRKRTQRR